MEPLVGTAVAVYDVTVTPEPRVGAVYVYTMELAVCDDEVKLVGGPTTV